MAEGTTPPPLPDAQGPAGPGAPPGPEADQQPLHAMLQTHQDTRTYPCTSCGGELEFHIGQQQLVCPHCRNVQQLREVQGQVLENDLSSAIANLRGKRLRTADPDDLAGDKEVVCQNCGGHTTFNGSLTSTRCPYCTTPIQRDDVHQAPARLPVDGILPFAVDAESAKAKLGEWVDSRRFAPTEFKSYSKGGSFASVYTAHFTYDAQAMTAYTGKRGDHHQVTVGSGEDERTETRTEWSRVRGTVQNAFDDVIVAANDGLNPQYIGQLAPWPMQQVKPFSPEFIAGHLSRTYDRDVEECAGEARSVMEAQITQAINHDIGGDEQQISTQQTRWSGLTYKHLLLPMWLLTVTYAGATYQVMINGATGKVVGERPYSKTKIIATIAAAIAVIVILVLVFQQ